MLKVESSCFHYCYWRQKNEGNEYNLGARRNEKKKTWHLKSGTGYRVRPFSYFDQLGETSIHTYLLW